MSEPSLIGTYHLSSDESVRELSGALPADLRFPIASVTKTLTALLAARLAVDDVISWDEPVQLPIDGVAPVTLRTLLTHTAGIPFELHPDHWTSTALTEAELEVALMHPPRLPLPPGTWHYSNLGYGLAARVLERATGQRYADLLGERVLEPLGMTRTSLPDEKTEGGGLLGAAAPAGDLWSTLDDLMTLARAIDGHRPEVVTWRMLALMLESAVADPGGACLGPGIRTQPVGPHRLVASTGTIRDRTTCVAVWPRRGASILVAEVGYSHDALRDAAAEYWTRADTVARTWWWDGQEVVELRFDDQVELRIRETTWPFALFSGRVSGQTLVGIDSRGLPLELADDGATLSGQGMLLTAAVSDSAYPGAPQP